MDEEAEVVHVALYSEEINMLVLGLTDWGGPATMTDPQAQQLGFVDADDVRELGEQIASRLAGTQSLSMRDWNSALTLTELAYEQEGDGWTTNNGGRPEDWIEVLGRLRSKLPPVSESQ